MNIEFVFLFCALAVAAVFAVIGIWEAFSDTPYAQAERRRKANARFKEIVSDRKTQDE